MFLAALPCAMSWASAGLPPPEPSLPLPDVDGSPPEVPVDPEDDAAPPESEPLEPPELEPPLEEPVADGSPAPEEDAPKAEVDEPPPEFKGAASACAVEAGTGEEISTVGGTM